MSGGPHVAGQQPSTPTPGVFSERILTMSCPDRPGLVHAVSGFLVDHDANIVASQQFGDSGNARFFMRVQFQMNAPHELGRLRSAFEPVARRHDMDWQILDTATPTRTLIMVSRLGHCLNDLLFRCRSGALNVTIPAIVSNHADFADLAASFGVPFHHLPVSAHTKQAAEDALAALVGDLAVDLVVLARYMQVLSPGLCQLLRGRAINIHHSFLPSFKGARPYHQAHERGVKLIGATAHYVTDDLDEGPIIEQDVTRVDHNAGAAELAAAGQDVEAQVLARAVRWHTEHRVLINNNRTVVFR